MDRALDAVFNQSGELRDYNLFSSHSAPVDACTTAARETLSGLGEHLGSAAMFALGDADHAALIRRCFAPHLP
jgi:hypothetical protein